jgi:cyclic pyranopterin phosphate synthase
MPDLSHVDAHGQATMVDVSGKPVTSRRAVAEGFVRMSAELVAAIRANTLKKGDLLAVAKIAGILAAKRTSDLVPLCHPLPLNHVDVHTALEDTGVRITASAATDGKTGVEMEALTAVSIAALTVIDMGKAVDPAMVIESIHLTEKRGGKKDFKVG